MKFITFPKLSRWFVCAFFAMLVSVSFANVASADETAQTEQEKLIDKQKKAQETLSTLSQLLLQQKEISVEVKELKDKLSQAQDDVSKKELEQQIAETTKKLGDVETQIDALAGGTTKQDFYASDNKPFDLQNELQGLAEPLIKIIKNSTKTAREIDQLQSSIKEAERRQAMAKNANERIEGLLAVFKDQSNGASYAQTQKFLKGQQDEWQERLIEAGNLKDASIKQLQLKQEQAEQSNLDNYASGFIRTRGINILLALLTFFGTFLFLRLFGRMVSFAYGKTGFKKSFSARLLKVVFDYGTIIIAFISTMAVLNYLNDWILLGLLGLLGLALIWIGIKVVPALIEQTVLLLNLGAVQEGERLMIDGVPWRVKRLDHYTEFENPVLDGGHFTLPIRELIGKHSRPPAEHEAWFPTHQDDWVQLDNGYIAKVESQTPELVQLIELGGGRLTYSTQEFVNATFRNLSTGFRIRQEFNISYKHQLQAVDQIPALLTKHLKTGLEGYIPADDINHVEVDLKAAANWAIEYDVEVDVKGSQAHRFEDIEGEITRLLIQACNIYELEIPFPQVVVHQPT